MDILFLFLLNVMIIYYKKYCNAVVTNLVKIEHMSKKIHNFYLILKFHFISQFEFITFISYQKKNNLKLWGMMIFMTMYLISHHSYAIRMTFFFVTQKV